MAENENSSDESQVSADAGNNKKKKEKKKETNDLFLPALVEFMFTFSAIILVLLFLTIVGTLLITRATLLDIIIRTGGAMLVIGGLLMLISRQVFLDVMNTRNVVEENLDPQPSEK